MFQLQEDQQQQNQIFKRQSNTKIFKILSWALVAFCFVLITLVIYSFLYDGVMQHHLVYQNYYLTIILLSIGLILSFNVMINYVFTILISPGCTQNFFIPEQKDIEQQQQIQNPEPDQNIIVRQIKFNYDPQQSKFNTSNLTSVLDQSTLKYCYICQLPKPQRTHHCTICNKCILKMDHHCPWINNCVGHQNHRHFLLFLTYVWLSTIYFSILNLHIKYSNDFKEFQENRTYIFNTMFIFDGSLSIMMILFGGWNWFLVLSGQTVIEYIDKKANLKFDKQILYENLRQVFGDFGCVCQIFLPSLRNLPSNGIIWNNINKIQEQIINIDVD